MHRARLQNIFTLAAAGAPANFAAQNLDNSPKLMWTEFMRNGDLDSLIRRVYSQGETFPRPVLWRLFECCELPRRPELVPKPPPSLPFPPKP